MADKPGLEIDDQAFISDIQRALADWRDEALKWQRERAERVLEAARRYAPRDTGTLADSIAITEGSDEDGPYVEVGTSLDYGIFQEYGTSVDPPHPFMRPAIAENSD